MLPIGHSSTGFLLSQLNSSQPKLKQILLFIFTANIFDLDTIFLLFLNKPIFIHHRLPTHTPLFGIFYFFLLYFVFLKKQNKEFNLLIILTILSHLILDSISYIIYPYIVNHQIAWFYPLFDPNRIIDTSLVNTSPTYDIELKTFSTYYFFKTPLVLLLELVLFVFSIFFYNKNYHRQN